MMAISIKRIDEITPLNSSTGTSNSQRANRGPMLEALALALGTNRLSARISHTKKQVLARVTMIAGHEGTMVVHQDVEARTEDQEGNKRPADKGPVARMDATVAAAAVTGNLFSRRRRLLEHLTRDRTREANIGRVMGNSQSLSPLLRRISSRRVEAHQSLASIRSLALAAVIKRPALIRGTKREDGQTRAKAWHTRVETVLAMPARTWDKEKRPMTSRDRLPS